jgi:hypothetical protein
VPTDPVTLAGLGLQSWDIVRSVVLSNMGTMELWIGDLLQAREHLGWRYSPVCRKACSSRD